jgi:hypothetical protein
VLLAVLGEVQSVAEELSHTNGKANQVFLAASDPEKRSFGGVHLMIIPEQVYSPALDGFK